jgi:hypothetical protein
VYDELQQETLRRKKLRFFSREALVFIFQVVSLSCLLGLAVDVVTANVAVEYFTVHHPHVVDSHSPWVMALVWGIGASWWFGLIASVLLWWMNVRRPQPLTGKRILRMIVPCLVVIWLLMMGIVAGVYSIAGQIPEKQRRVTFESDRRLMAVALSHSTEYALGGIVTIVLWFRSLVSGSSRGLSAGPEPACWLFSSHENTIAFPRWFKKSPPR